MGKSVIYINGYDYLSNQDICNTIAIKINAQIIYINAKNALMEFNAYDLIGFGVGINSGNHYKQILEFVGNLPNVQNKKAFIFCTSGIIHSEKHMIRDYKELLNLLENKGFVIMNDFNLKGFNTGNILKCINEINKDNQNKKNIK
jgi:hypothetical protein